VPGSSPGRKNSILSDEYTPAPNQRNSPLLCFTLDFIDALTCDGRLEANMVGARGYPYDCSFCGAAVSANPDITIRTREPAKHHSGDARAGAPLRRDAFRFVDDLFPGYERFIRQCMNAFTTARIGYRYVRDATGRINILHRMGDDMLELLRDNGCREIALGIESGSARLLSNMGKRITPEMARSVVQRLTHHGISVKGQPRCLR
jgi:anaerobic magnesium-protoporphyrin IX monomethyl ester cyclase